MILLRMEARSKAVLPVINRRRYLTASGCETSIVRLRGALTRVFFGTVDMDFAEENFSIEVWV
jgi:hypothetical protein